MACGSQSTSRILITGASGFVGRHLVAHLLQRAREQGDSLHLICGVRRETSVVDAGWVASVIPQDAPSTLTVKLVPLDVTDIPAMTRVLEETHPDVIYHLAGRASGADRDRDAVFAVNVEGTRNLLVAARTLHPSPRVLLISSGYVYGNTSPLHPSRETDPIAVTGQYGIYTDSKIMMECMAQEFADSVVIARPFNHTGPGQAANFAISAFANQLARIEAGLASPTLYVGNLEAQRDILDVRDVVRAYPLLVQHGEPGSAVNISTGHPVSVRFVLDALRTLCRVPTEVAVDPARLRPADIACSSGNPALIQDTIGWRPEWDLNATLSDSLDYWRMEVANSGPP